MFIVWGSKGNDINLGQLETSVCKTCEKERPFSVHLTYTYFGFYWIFNFVTQKHYRLSCDVCRYGWELESRKVEENLSKVPIPFFHRWSLALLLGSLVAIFALPLLYAHVQSLLRLT